jgi:uncharacterized membrane protein
MDKSKSEFLTRLRAALDRLPAYEIDQMLAFYAEMIDDRVEAGMTEEQATESLGNVEVIAERLIAQTPPIPKAITRVKTKSRALNIVLLIVGAPIWIPLAIAFAVTAFAIWLTIWALLVSLWAVIAALLLSGIVGIATGLYLLVTLHPLTALLSVGMGLFCIGIGLFSYFGVLAASKGLYRLTTLFAGKIRSLFIREARHDEV